MQPLRQNSSVPGSWASWCCVLLCLLVVSGCGGKNDGNLAGGSYKLLEHPEAYIRLEGMPEFDDLVNYMIVTDVNDTGGNDMATVFKGRRGFSWDWTQPVSFDVTLPGNPTLTFEWGVTAEAMGWGKKFKIVVTLTQGGKQKTVVDIDANSGQGSVESPWIKHTVKLNAFTEGDARLTFDIQGWQGKDIKENFLLTSPRIYSGGRENCRRVFFIGVDTLRADHVSCYGYKRTTSPNIDKIAAEGARYDYCVSTSPWTYPAFSTMMVGHYPTASQATTYLTYLPDEETTLAEILSGEGFSTFSAVNNMWTGVPVNLHQGFDGSVRYVNRQAVWTYESVKEWIRSHGEEDIFVFMQFMDPHVPYWPPGEYCEMYDPDYAGRFKKKFHFDDKYRYAENSFTDRELAHLIALYDGEITYWDSQFGKFLKFLEEEGMYEDALIVITSDHGEEFYEHGGFEHGHSLYDEVLHVPLIIRGPGIQPGVQDERLTSTMDIFPTILDYFDIAIPDGIDGISLLASSPGGERSLIAEQLLWGDELKGVTTSQYRYILNPLTGKEELFDLTVDRGMQFSVADERRATTRTFREFTYNYLAERGTPWHIYFTRAEGTEGPLTYTGTIKCPGGFAAIDRFRLDGTDFVEVDGDMIEFRISLDFPFEKEIGLVINDESSEVCFDVTRNGSPMTGGNVYIGPMLSNVTTMPFTLGIQDERFILMDPEVKGAIPEGLFIWAMKGSFPEAIKIDHPHDVEEELRSLGYLQ